MRTLVVIVLVLMVTACMSTSEIRPKVKWGQGDRGGNPVIVWNWAKDADDANLTCRGMSREPPTLFLRIKGCSVIRGNECHIYAARPTTEDEYTTLFHELRHCTDGHWHDKFNRENPNNQRWR